MAAGSLGVGVGRVVGVGAAAVAGGGGVPFAPLTGRVAAGAVDAADPCEAVWVSPKTAPAPTPRNSPAARPKPMNPEAFPSVTPRRRRVRQPGHRRAPGASGRAHDGHSKIVCSISPIAIDGATAMTGSGAGALAGARRRVRRATSTVIWVRR